MAVWLCPQPAAKIDSTYLLQLLVFQITPNHHLQHDEQFPIADVAVAINVVHLEGESQFLFLVTLRTESAEPRYKFLKVNISTSIFVEYGYHSSMT